MLNDGVSIPFVWFILLSNCVALLFFFVLILYVRAKTKYGKLLRVIRARNLLIKDIKDKVHHLLDRIQALNETKKLFLAMRTKCEALVKENDILYSTVLRSLDSNLSPQTVELMKYYHINVEAVLEYLQMDDIKQLVNKQSAGVSSNLGKSIADLQGMNQILFANDLSEAGVSSDKYEKAEFKEEFEGKMKSLELSLRDSEMCVKTLEDQLDIDHQKLLEAEKNNAELLKRLKQVMHDNSDLENKLVQIESRLSASDSVSDSDSNIDLSTNSSGDLRSESSSDSSSKSTGNSRSDPTTLVQPEVQAKVVQPSESIKAEMDDLVNQLNRSNGLIEILQDEKSEHLELIDQMKVDKKIANDKITELEQKLQNLRDEFDNQQGRKSKAI